VFGNYFKTALRSIAKHKGYSFINITGLAIGMACCLLILMFVNDELSYDNYHENADRIYRVAGAIRFGGRDFNHAVCPAPMAKTLLSDYPDIIDAVRFRDSGSFIVKYGDNSFKETRFIYSDNSIFNVFTIPLLQGDSKTALRNPKTLVMSRKTAEKYFGTENPMGKVIKIDNKTDYIVTGIFDKIPSNSHFHFDMIASIESIEESREVAWLNNNFQTYLLLGKNVDPKSMEAKFPEMIKKYMAPQVQQYLGQSLEKLVANGSVNIRFYLQPLRNIHLHSDLVAELEANSDIKYVYIFSAIALFVLIIASINFMNLSTARSAGRAKEVGIRKVMGSTRSRLIGQFLSESMLLSTIAMLIALVLVNLALPFFNNLSGKELTMANNYSLPMVLSMLLITLLTGLLAGSYPAFMISAFLPISVLKGQFKSGAKSGSLRSGLVVFQFTASIILIIGTLVVMNQLDYIRNKKLGFDKEQVLILHNTYLLNDQAETFKNELLKSPHIKYATISGYLPVPSNRNVSGVFPEGKYDEKTSTAIQIWRVDHDYIKTLGMNIIEGRDFSKEFSTDTSAAIINRKTVEQFGWDKPLGKRISRFKNNEDVLEDFTVIGVVEDFHFDSLRDNIGPLMMYPGDNKELISFRIDSGDIAGTIGLLKDTWNRFLPDQPFEYSFLDERFNNVYRAEQRIGKIFASFAVLAIFVGCLGLFGLAAFVAEQRTKEIGIRKVLGASVSSIIALLSKEFVLLVGIANLIAWPIAYFIMKQWLQDFAYKTALSPWTFLAAGITALLIALITISFQSIKAALANPVKSIKYE
jgi:putative ABC transport system permease protein